MERRKCFGCLCALLMLVLPGCGRFIDWGKANFYQGNKVADPSCNVKPYIRSVTIYDQFTTKATFNVLWLSDEVRETYARFHTTRQGGNDEKLESLLYRQLEENEHYVSFYVLSLYEIKLGEPESSWSFFMKLNDVYYQPLEIKRVELPYEYQIFMGTTWNRFKVPYLVRFANRDVDGLPLITEQTEDISLYVRSAFKEHVLIWNVHEDKTYCEGNDSAKTKTSDKNSA